MSWTRFTAFRRLSHIGAELEPGAPSPEATLRTNDVNVERSCVKCGSARTRIAGQSVSPAVLHIACENCGYSSMVPCSSPPGGASAHTLDAVRLERLVRSIIADFDLPLELVAVADAGEGWRLTLRTRLNRPVRVHVASTDPSAVRVAITRALANA